MDDLTKKHLQDILTAIEEIESFFGSEPKLYDDFYSNSNNNNFYTMNVYYTIHSTTDVEGFVNREYIIEEKNIEKVLDLVAK